MKKTDNNKKTKMEKEDIQTLIDEADWKTVKDFFVDQLYNDSTLFAYFKIALTPEGSEDQIIAYKSEIDKYIDEFCENVASDNLYNNYNWGYQNYNQGHNSKAYGEATDKLMSSLSYLIEDGIDNLTKQGHYARSLELIFYLLTKAYDIPGGNDKVRVIISKKCVGSLTLICDQDESRKEVVLEQIVKHVLSEPQNIWNITLYDYVMISFEGPAFLVGKIKLSKHYLNRLDQFLDPYYRNPYIHGMEDSQGEKVLIKYINLMNEDPVTYKEELRNTLKKYSYIKKIRDFYLQNCINSKAYPEAITVLEDTISNYATSIEKRELSTKLKDLYKEIDDREMYLNELWILATNYSVGDPKIYGELKEQYTEEEWKQARTILYKLYNQQGIIYKFYALEKLDELLLEYIKKSQNQRILEIYGDQLAPNYSHEILEIYENMIQQKVDNSPKRKTYIDVVQTMKHMKTFRGGKQRVLRIVEQWQNYYSNRPALLEELNKL